MNTIFFSRCNLSKSEDILLLMWPSTFSAKDMRTAKERLCYSILLLTMYGN